MPEQNPHLKPQKTSGSFNIPKLAAAFPETAETMLLDTYLTDQESASTRVFRVYRPTPAHYHAHCDEHLYVVSGRGTFWMNDPSEPIVFGPGTLLVFPRGTVHAMPSIAEFPVVFLSVDTPRRNPTDVIFVDPSEGTPQSFIRRQD